MKKSMKKSAKVLTFLLALVMTFAVMPFTSLVAYAGVSGYITVTRENSYNKDGSFHLPYTIENRSSSATIRVSAKLLDSSGRVKKEFDRIDIGPKKAKTCTFSYKHTELPSGSYKLVMRVANWNYAYGEFDAEEWTRTFDHKAPEASFSFQSYESYYDKNGYLIHRVNVRCKNMKGHGLYCKIYDADGYLVYDFGTDTVNRKTNDEIGYFWWSGYANGKKFPSGEYTFVITSSANKKVVEKTLDLKILEVSKG